MFFPVHAHRCTDGKLGRREVGGGRGSPISSRKSFILCTYSQIKIYCTFTGFHHFYGTTFILDDLHCTVHCMCSQGLAAILKTISDNDTAIQLDRYNKRFFDEAMKKNFTNYFSTGEAIQSAPN